MRAEVRAGRLDGDAAAAVLTAAEAPGHQADRPASRADQPRGRGTAAARERGCQTGRSPSGWSSRPGPPATTSSTSTPRPGPPTGPWPASSPPPTASSGGRPEAGLGSCSRRGRVAASPGCSASRVKNRPVPGAEQAHPADATALGRVVVGLLLDR